MPKFYADIPYRMYQDPVPGESKLPDLGQQHFRLVIEAHNQADAFVKINSAMNKLVEEALKRPTPGPGPRDRASALSTPGPRDAGALVELLDAPEVRQGQEARRLDLGGLVDGQRTLASHEGSLHGNDSLRRSVGRRRLLHRPSRAWARQPPPMTTGG